MTDNSTIEGSHPASRSRRFTGTITDLTTGAAFQPTTVKMTLYDPDRARKGEAAILNSRLDSDITSSVTLGVIDLTLTEADMAMLDSAKQSEDRAMLIYWDYNGGDDSGEMTVRFRVYRNQVPTS